MKKLLWSAIFLGACLACGQALACTGVVMTGDGKVLVGNNEDWLNPRAKIWFIQPHKGRYGAIIFGFDNLRPQGGMNQKGLFFDHFSVRTIKASKRPHKPRFKGNPFIEMLATCATVKEALAYFEKHDRSFMHSFQALLADASGDSVILEGNAVVPRKGRYQVVTNFRQSQAAPGQITCARYRIAKAILAKCKQPDLVCLRRILDATHNEGAYPTLYSNIYDLKAKKAWVYHFHNFQEVVVFDLEKELQKKTGVLDLPGLFSPKQADIAFRDRYTNLKQTYRHREPRFSLRYPSSYETVKPVMEGNVFLAECRYGKVPVLSASVIKPEGSVSLSQCSQVYIQKLKKLGTRIRIISNRPAKLADGSDAYEAKISWMLRGKHKLNSMVLFALRGGKIISVGLHHAGELQYLRHIPYSLKFE